MFTSYYRKQLLFTLPIAAFFLVQIAQKKLDWGWNYVETQARIEKLEQRCAEGRNGPVRYVDCSEALPGADRRTMIELGYVSPADGMRHYAIVRCDTEAEKTPALAVGGELALLVHRSKPDRADRRRCTTMRSRR